MSEKEMDEISLILSRDVYLTLVSKFKSQCCKHFTSIFDSLKTVADMPRCSQIFLGGSMGEGTGLYGSDLDMTNILNGIVSFKDRKQQNIPVCIYCS